MNTRKLRNIFKTLAIVCIALALTGGIILVGCNVIVWVSASGKVNQPQVPQCDAILVLGAKVYGDTPSRLLKDRIEKGVELYKAGVANRIIMSGDHGTEGYDEVNVMKATAVELGVPEEHIFTDHAGFDTYSSLYRAKEIFLCESVAVVTNEFHISRSVFLGNALGLECYGYTCNQENYTPSFFTRWVREPIARVKDCFWAMYKPLPKYLGETVPIFGEASASWD